jgi:hypothetical protein
MMLSALLLLVFLVHLTVFAVLGIRRRQRYYLALVVTFTLLSAAMLARLLAPGLELTAGVGLADALRAAAWAAAVVSVGWTLLRIRARRAHRRDRRE